MNRPLIDTFFVTVSAVFGSIAITYGVHVFYPSNDIGFSLALATICPLLVSPPLSYWHFKRGDIIKNLYRELEISNEKLIEANKRLEKYAVIDGMTGLLNRSAFFAVLEETTQETGGTMLMIDADHFKSINDTYGHSTGDRALLVIADTILHLSHGATLAGRLGGEEFAVFLPEIAEEQGAGFAEALRHRIEKTARETMEGAREVTVSIGVATATRGVSPDDLYRAADRALYEAKRNGRNKVVRASLTIRPRSPA